MSKQVVFTEAQAKRIWAATKQMEQMASKATGYDRFARQSPPELPVYIHNDTEEAILPYSPVVISAYSYDSDAELPEQARLVVKVKLPGEFQIHPKDTPKANSNSCTVTHDVQVRSQIVLFNGGKSIEPGAIGLAQRGDIVIARYRGEDVPPAFDAEGTQEFTSFSPGVSTIDGRDYLVQTLPSQIDPFEMPRVNCGMFLGLLPRRSENTNLDASAEPPPFAFPAVHIGTPLPVVQPTPPEDDMETRLCFVRTIYNQQSTKWAYCKLIPESADGTKCNAEVIYESGDYYLKDSIVEIRFVVAADLYLLGPETDTFVWAFKPTSPWTWLHTENDADWGQKIFGSTEYDFLLCHEPPRKVDCEQINACISEEGALCDLVAGCFDDPGFLDLLCDKVKECLGLEENEDIDDRIDQRLQQLCTCDTFIDGVSIVGNDWVFTTNEICYVACPDGGGGAGANIVIEGTDCPEDAPGEPEP
jgi:hypothetical protein